MYAALEESSESEPDSDSTSDPGGSRSSGTTSASDEFENDDEEDEDDEEEVELGDANSDASPGAPLRKFAPSLGGSSSSLNRVRARVKGPIIARVLNSCPKRVLRTQSCVLVD